MISSSVAKGGPSPYDCVDFVTTVTQDVPFSAETIYGKDYRISDSISKHPSTRQARLLVYFCTQSRDQQAWECCAITTIESLRAIDVYKDTASPTFPGVR